MRASGESPLFRHSIRAERLKCRAAVHSITVASTAPSAAHSRPAAVFARHMNAGVFEFTRTATPKIGNSDVPNSGCQYCISNAMSEHFNKYFPSEITLMLDVTLNANTELEGPRLSHLEHGRTLSVAA